MTSYIGRVGQTGTDNSHLHLSFKTLDAAAGVFKSYCNSLSSCSTTPVAPQGSRPTPMMTADGLTTFVDFGSYTSTNGQLYFADLQTPSGWANTIYVRNNGRQTRTATATLKNADGTTNSTSTGGCSNLAIKNTCTIAGPVNFQGSGYLDGAENITAVAILDNGTRAYALEGLPSGASGHGGLGTAPTVYGPSYLVNYYGWNSTLTVGNASNSATSVTAFLYDDNGTQVGTTPPTSLAGNGRVTLSLGGVAAGAVRVVSSNATRPLSIVIKHENASVDTIAYPGMVRGGPSNFLASLLKNYYGWTSAYNIQEVNGIGGSVTATYYPSGSESYSLNARGRREFYLGADANFPNGAGAGKVANSSFGSLVVSSIHHSQGFYGLGYPAVNAGSMELYLPVVKKNVDGWDASVTIYNTGPGTATATMIQYNSSGSVVATNVFTIAALASKEAYTEIVNGVSSVYVFTTTSTPLVAVAHMTNANGRGVGYTAIPNP